MEYSEQDFSITLTGNILTFSGKLEKSDYSGIDAFLRDVDQAISDRLCAIELRELTFLNSSGIRSLATFILGSPKNFELHINKSLTWQTESIPALKHLKPKGITVVS
jgi:hypothetical protein